MKPRHRPGPCAPPPRTFRNREPDTPLHRALAQQLGLSGKQARRLIDQRCVFVNGRRIWMARHLLKTGDVIEIFEPHGSGNHKEVPPVLYEDAACLVINKPPGLLANGPGSAEQIFQEQRDNPSLRAVHRLDRDTSGCLLLAKDPTAYRFLVREFRKQRVRKRYIALTLGVPGKPRGTINKPLAGRSAVTHYETTAAGKQAACLHLEIETGRTHQIRLHLASIGHPVLGDKEHLTLRLDDPALRAIDRQQLHAAHLSFHSPAHPERCIHTQAPEPGDLARNARRFHMTALKRVSGCLACRRARGCQPTD